MNESIESEFQKLMARIHLAQRRLMVPGTGRTQSFQELTEVADELHAENDEVAGSYHQETGHMPWER